MMGALALMGAAMPSMAGFINGGFEDGTLNGWDVKWGKTDYGSFASGLGWESKFTQYGSLTKGIGNQLPAGSDIKHPGNTTDNNIYLHAGVVNWNYPDAVYPALSTAAPPTIGGAANTKKLLLNVRPNMSNDVLLSGLWDVTQISQTTTITAADKQPNGKYSAYLYWASILTDPQGHLKPDEQPFVSVSITATHQGEGAPYTEFNEFYTTDLGGVNGWAKVPNRVAEFFKQRIDSLPNLSLNDIVTIKITTGDCGQGGHGGYTYVDHAGFFRPDTIKLDDTAAPCLYAVKSVFVGNNDNITSSIGSKGPIQVQMGSKVTGDIISTGKTFYQGWQKPVALYNNSVVTGNVKTGYSSIYKDQTATIGGVTTLGYTKTFPVLVPKTVTVGSANVYPPSNSIAYTVAPGRYNNFAANPGAIVLLSTGTYEFNEFHATGTKILLDVSNGPISINVKSVLNLSTGTTTTAINGSFLDLNSRDVFWYSNGRLSIGDNTVLKGQFLAPFNEDWDQIGTNVTLIGSVKASTINISTGANLTCQDK